MIINLLPWHPPLPHLLDLPGFQAVGLSGRLLLSFRGLGRAAAQLLGAALAGLRKSTASDLAEVNLMR